MEDSDFATHFIEKMEQAQNIEELDAIAKDIKGWRDLLARYYQSNKKRLLGKPYDINTIFNKRGVNTITKRKNA